MIAIGSERGGGTPPAAAWGTHVWVDSADEAGTKVREAGRSVVAEPSDLLDAARIAVLADLDGPCSACGSRANTGERSRPTSPAPGR